MSPEKQALEPAPQSLGAKVPTPQTHSLRARLTTYIKNIRNTLSDTLALTEEDEHAQGYGIGSAGPGVAQRINRQGEKAKQEAKDAKKNKKSTVIA